MKIEVRPLDIDLYQLLVHEAWHCGAINEGMIADEVNGYLSAIVDSHNVQLISPDDCGLDRFVFRDEDGTTYPSHRTYSIKEARASIPDWLRLKVDELNKLEVLL